MSLPSELNAENYHKHLAADEDLDVYFNGERITDCTAANVDEGWADRITGYTTTAPIIERFRGVVEFRVVPRRS